MQFELGLLYCRGQGVPLDYAQCAFWYRKAAEKGLSSGEGALAGLLLSGTGVPQNTSEGIAWYQKAANQGDVISALMLGQLYEAGGPMKIVREPGGKFSVGPLPLAAAIPKDFAMAAFWCRKAADQGNAVAQNDLGKLYEDGEGVPQGYKEAYFWLNLGEANRITSTTNGVDDRDHVANHLSKPALLQTQERAQKWFEDHAAKTPAQ